MAAALEITFIGPELVADGDVVAVVTGAEFDTLMDATPIPHEHPSRCRPAAGFALARAKAGPARRLRSGADSSCRLTLGSRATHLASAMGAFDGRALRAGDDCRSGNRSRATRSVEASRWRCHAWRHACVLWRPLTAIDLRTRRGLRSASERFVITPDSNRMGYRLDGPAPRARRGADLLSEAMPIGAIQVPASGASDPVDGRSPDDRRVSHNRQGDPCRPSAGGPARARRLDRIRAVHDRRRDRGPSRARGGALDAGAA